MLIAVLVMLIKLLDVNPNNIFLSNINVPIPVVKLGDLGTGMSSCTP